MARIIQHFLLFCVLCFCYTPFAVAKEFTRKLPHFSSVSVSSDLTVIVRSAFRQHVTLRGHPEAVAGISTRVSHGTLYIRRLFSPPSEAAGLYSRHVVIDVAVSGPVFALYTQDTALLIVRSIRSHGLYLNIQGASLVRLDAHHVPLRKVIHEGSRNLSLSGIHGKTLYVYGGGSGKITLHGRVTNLTARVCDTACLNARALHVENAYIHTEDGALAMVTPFHALYAYAFGRSNVYYYKTPAKLVVRTENRGNVLKIP